MSTLKIYYCRTVEDNIFFQFAFPAVSSGEKHVCFIVVTIIIWIQFIINTFIFIFEYF